MRDDGPDRSVSALIYASILGPLTVIFLYFAWMILTEPSRLPSLPHAISEDFVMGAIAFAADILSFIFAAGIMCLPVLLALRRPFARWLDMHRAVWPWVLCILLASAIVGGILSAIATVILGFDGSVIAMGSALGAPTGLWYWFFSRRALVAGAALANEP